MFPNGFRAIVARRSRFFSIALIGLSGLLLGACSLASPAPVNVNGPMGSGSNAPFAQGNQTPQPVQLPSRRPSAAEGAKYFAEKCVGCHGQQGRGDGEKAAQIQAQFGSPVSDLTSDAVARAQTPEAWYNIITNGNLQAGMPPFASLTADQRWDVIAYVWSLAAPQVQIDKGKEVYLKQCVQCHGDTGKGDGKDAQGKLLDLSQFSTIAPVEAGRWDQALTSSHVPSFAGTTSELERRASIDYIRTFAYDYAAPGSTTTAAAPGATPAAGNTSATPAPNSNATPAPSSTGSAITVEGYLVNGTTGQPEAANLPITFYVFPGGTGDTSITHTYQADATGHFVITTTEAKTGDLIAATTEYKQLNFFSSLENYGPHVTVPITIYENTADASQVTVDTLHIVAAPGADGLAVSEIYVLSNNGNKIVAGFGQPVMHFSLPRNIQNFSVDQNTRADTVVQNGDGFEYFDAIPVGTNAGQIIVQYVIPNQPYALDRTLAQAVGSVNLLVQGDAAQTNVNSSQLTAAGEQNMSGTSYQRFTATSLAAGSNLVASIGGTAAPVNWTAIAGVALIVVGVGGVFIWQRSRSKSAPVADSGTQQDALIDQIAALDDEFAAGQIDEVNYKAKRAKLKERLLKMMSDK